MNDEILDQNFTLGNETINYDTKCETLISEGYEFNFGEYINRGFDIFKKNAGGFIGYTLLIGLGMVVINYIPLIGRMLGQIANIVLTPALLAGFFIVAKKIAHEEPCQFKDFFRGFDFFLQLFLANLVSGLFIATGFLLLVVPGIYFIVAYLWVSLFIVFARKEFWSAMELSRKVISKKWLSFFGFILVLLLINIMGLLALGIGLLVTIPATILALFAAFHDIVGTNSEYPRTINEK